MAAAAADNGGRQLAPEEALHHRLGLLRRGNPRSRLAPCVRAVLCAHPPHHWLPFLAVGIRCSLAPVKDDLMVYVQSASVVRIEGDTMSGHDCSNILELG